MPTERKRSGYCSHQPLASRKCRTARLAYVTKTTVAHVHRIIASALARIIANLNTDESDCMTMFDSPRPDRAISKTSTYQYARRKNYASICGI